MAGENVHRAARVCGEAAGAEILASEGVVASAKAEGLVRDRRSIDLKGFPDPVRLYEVTATA